MNQQSNRLISALITSSILLTYAPCALSIEISQQNVISIDQFVCDQELEQLIEYDITTEQAPFIGDTFSLYTRQHLAQTKQIPQGSNPKKKDWTFIVYAAADNDLRPFALRNIKQMAQVGSNDRITIFVHLDIVAQGKQKVTRRYIINKNELVSVDEEQTNKGYMDSGNPETLISCCKWAIENCPAERYALVFWNHGSGAIDPQRAKTIHPITLFSINQNQRKLEVDRSLNYLDVISNRDAYTGLVHQKAQEAHQIMYPEHLHIPEHLDINKTDLLSLDGYLLSLIMLIRRGICWDDTTGNYLTNQNLDYALNTICSECLDGNKFDLIAFDACLMSMIEVANIIRKYSHIMTASQEVELGYGWNYEKVLAPFRTTTLTPEAFGAHIVRMFEATYNKLTNDFTQSALDLIGIELLEMNISSVARLLREALKLQKNRSVKNTLKLCKSRLACTHFDEPSYIDLHHLYSNMLINLKKFTFTNEQRGEQIKQGLKQALEYGISLIEQTVLANAVGKNLKKARGISIYFPERRLHSSYKKTTFAQATGWGSFLELYLRT